MRLTWSQIWTLSPCSPADAPPAPGAVERQHTLRPLVGSPGEAQRTEGRGGASDSPSTSLPHPSTRGAEARLAHPSASRSLAPTLVSSRSPHIPGPGRPVRLTRFVRRCGQTPRRTSRRKVSSEERGGTGRGGAKRREEERLEEGERGRPLLPYRKPLGRPLTGAAPASTNNTISY